MGNIIVGAVVFGVLGAVIVRMIIGRCKGKDCCGCPGCGKR